LRSAAPAALTHNLAQDFSAPPGRLILLSPGAK
jgi:hypothetical protein